MLKSYEATLDHGQVKWLAEQPDIDCARIIVTILEETAPHLQRRPSAAIAGQGKTIGDIVSPVVDQEDWECLK
ncbi:MAG: hypothetical protein L0Y43_02335 [Methylococcaceae bacterium]|nr:hypothetical protein [Methylococcaceae bacterium]